MYFIIFLLLAFIIAAWIAYARCQDTDLIVIPVAATMICCVIITAILTEGGFETKKEKIEEIQIVYGEYHTVLSTPREVRIITSISETAELRSKTNFFYKIKYNFFKTEKRREIVWE